MLESNAEIKLTNYLFLIIALIPLWWILGAKIFIFHLMALAIFIINIRKIKSLDKMIWSLGGCIVVYSISIIIALVCNPLGAKVTTVLAQIYTLSYWSIGILIIIGINLLNELNIKSLKRILKAFIIVGIATIVIFLVATILWKVGVENTTTPSLLSRIWPKNLKIDMFEEMMQVNYSVLDAIFNEHTGIKEVFFRFNGFYAYPTEGAMATLLILVYSVLYFSICNIERIKSKTIFRSIYILMLIIIIYFFRSRTIILGSFLALVIVLLIKKINKENIRKMVLISIGILIAIVFLGSISGVFDKLLNMRPGSNSVRLMVYQNTLETFFNHPFGVGMPFRIEGLDIPIGSHSTYFGILMKGGIIGFISIITFKVLMFVQIFKNKRYISNKINKRIWEITTYVFVMSSMWMLIDDLDWPIVMAIFYFINCALILKFKDIRVSNEDKIDMNKIKVALVGSSGGHLTHLIQMREWWSNKERLWVTFNKADATSQLEGEKVYWCYYPTNRNVKNLIKNSFLALKVLIKEKPNLIVSSGAASAIPFFYLGKLFGAKLIYIEVYDRVDSPTLTGKIVYPICDEFIVQWDEQLKFYPKAKMLGGLF